MGEKSIHKPLLDSHHCSATPSVIKDRWYFLILIFLFILFFFLDIFLGSVAVKPLDVIKALAGKQMTILRLLYLNSGFQKQLLPYLLELHYR